MLAHHDGLSQKFDGALAGGGLLGLRRPGMGRAVGTFVCCSLHNAG